MDANTANTAASALSRLPAAITAVGALGTAAFGLVDALKTLPGGGISRLGFAFIKETIERLAPDVPQFNGTGLSQHSILFTLRSHWINGTDADDQLKIAKSLIKLRLVPETAEGLAKATGVDVATLKSVAEKIQAGKALDSKDVPPKDEAERPVPRSNQETDTYGRFDLLLTTLLDQAYQRGSQRYRNAAKTAAIPVSVILAVVAANMVPQLNVTDSQAVLIGLIATPIAPIAKDVATAIQTAVKALQAAKA